MEKPYWEGKHYAFFSNGNAIEVVDRFVTDETGEIITYEKLKAGTYKVYEIEGPEGYKVNE